MEESKTALPAVKLVDVLSGTGCALLSAKVSMDLLSSQVSKDYEKDALLSLVSLPFFSFSDVTVDIKFAVANLGENNEVYVHIDSTSLQQLSQNIISHVELKVAQSKIRTYKDESGKSLHVHE